MNQDRYHSLDVVRGAMLLLGLVLHNSVSYFPPTDQWRKPTDWYFYDADGSIVLVGVFACIHVYRMPIFFVLAGFFAALMIQRRGINRFVANRMQRVGGPLLAGVLSLLPLLYLASHSAQSLDSKSDSLATRDNLLQFIWNDFHYLWFLWHLLILYAFTVVAIGFAVAAKKNRLWQWLQLRVKAPTNFRWAGACFIFLATLLLSQMQGIPGFLDTSDTYWPTWYVLGLHGLCFAFGLGLFWKMQYQPYQVAHARLRMFLGAAAVAIYLSAVAGYLSAGRPRSVELPLAAISAVAIWLMIDGVLAIAVKYCDRPSRWGRYIADSSYWVYLVHLPVLIASQRLVASLAAPAEIKYLASLAIGSAVCFASYHWLVRSTWIGQFLNGRRYPQP